MALSGQQVGTVTHDSQDADAAGCSTDDAEFASVIPQHATAILRVAAALVGPADAEDAAQEAITRGWQAWPTLRDKAAARSWLLRITVNVCRDWQRGRFGTRRRLTEPLSENDVLPPALLGGDPGASDHANALDLRGAIDILSDDLRLVVVLRYYSGMDATEVGAILGIPPATVRTRLRRALRELRSHMTAATPSTPTTVGVRARGGMPSLGDAHEL